MTKINEDIDIAPKILAQLERKLKYGQVGKEMYNKEMKKLRIKFEKSKKTDKKIIIRKYIEQLRTVCEERDKNIKKFLADNRKTRIKLQKLNDYLEEENFIKIKSELYKSKL